MRSRTSLMSSAPTLPMSNLAERYGVVLAGRQPASEIRAEIERLVGSGEIVTVDLDGIVTMSPSFADELFGKLAASMESGKVRFQHLNDHLRVVAEMAVAGRHRQG